MQTAARADRVAGDLDQADSIGRSLPRSSLQDEMQPVMKRGFDVFAQPAAPGDLQTPVEVVGELQPVRVGGVVTFAVSDPPCSHTKPLTPITLASSPLCALLRKISRKRGASTVLA